MSKKFFIEIKTPDALIWSGEIESLVVNHPWGLEGYLADHESVLKELSPGPIKVSGGDADNATEEISSLLASLASLSAGSVVSSGIGADSGSNANSGSNSGTAYRDLHSSSADPENPYGWLSFSAEENRAILFLHSL